MRWHVTNSPPAIQEAINAAASGDEILIAGPAGVQLVLDGPLVLPARKRLIIRLDDDAPHPEGRS